MHKLSLYYFKKLLYTPYPLFLLFRLDKVTEDKKLRGVFGYLEYQVFGVAQSMALLLIDEFYLLIFYITILYILRFIPSDITF